MSSENKYFAKESEYAIKSIEKINYNDLSEEKIQEIITETNKSRKKFFDELNEKTDENGSAETTDSKTNYKKSTSITKRFKEMLLISGIAKTEGSAKSILSEMKNGKKPFEEDKARIYCFAAGLNTMETNDTLRKVFGFYGLYMRDYKDIIYSFFFRNNSEELCIDKFKEATEIINEYKEKYESEKNKDAEHNTERKSTAYFEERVKRADTIEDLKKLLDIVVKNSGAKHRTATTEYCSLVNGVIVIAFREISKIYYNNKASKAFSEFTLDYAKFPYQNQEFVNAPIELYWESLRRLTDYLMPFNTFLYNKVNNIEAYNYLLYYWRNNYNYSIEYFEKERKTSSESIKTPVKNSDKFVKIAEWISKEYNKDYDTVVNELRNTFIKNVFSIHFAINKYDYMYFINKWKSKDRALKSFAKVLQHSDATNQLTVNTEAKKNNEAHWFPKEGYNIFDITVKNCDECKHYELCDQCIHDVSCKECKSCEKCHRNICPTKKRKVCEECIHYDYCSPLNLNNYEGARKESEKKICENNKEVVKIGRCNQCKYHRIEKCKDCDICIGFNGKVYTENVFSFEAASKILSLDYLDITNTNGGIEYKNLCDNYLTFKPTINSSYDLIRLLLSIFYKSTCKEGLIDNNEMDMPNYLINNKSFIKRIKVYINALKNESIDIKDYAKSRAVLVFMKLIKEIILPPVDEDGKMSFKMVEYNYIIGSINGLLEECNMAWLDPYNPFDLFVILALKTKNPIYVLYSSLVLFDEEEQEN